MGFCSDGPCECIGQIWAFPVPEIIAGTGYLKTLGSRWIRRSRSSKVVDFGTKRKRVCDFLLVRHSYLGPILHPFWDIAGFCASEWPHPYSTLILGVFTLHQFAHIYIYVRVSTCISLKLFVCEIIFETFQPMWSRYLNVTDGQPDNIQYCGITALCVASRGKNRSGW